MALTFKQERFCQEYVKTGDFAAAAILAGYNKKAAVGIGKRNLKIPKIVLRISELRLAGVGMVDDVSDEEVAGGVEILQFLTDVMRGDVRDSKSVVDKASGDVIQLEDLPKISERTKAAELLGKTTALFSDKAGGSKVVSPVVIYGEHELED